MGYRLSDEPVWFEPNAQGDTDATCRLQLTRPDMDDHWLLLQKASVLQSIKDAKPTEQMAMIVATVRESAPIILKRVKAIEGIDIGGRPATAEDLISRPELFPVTVETLIKLGSLGRVDDTLKKKSPTSSKPDKPSPTPTSPSGSSASISATDGSRRGANT